MCDGGISASLSPAAFDSRARTGTGTGSRSRTGVVDCFDDYLFNRHLQAIEHGERGVALSYLSHHPEDDDDGGSDFFFRPGKDDFPQHRQNFYYSDDEEEEEDIDVDGEDEDLSTSPSLTKTDTVSFTDDREATITDPFGLRQRHIDDGRDDDVDSEDDDDIDEEDGCDEDVDSEDDDIDEEDEDLIGLYLLSESDTPIFTDDTEAIITKSLGLRRPFFLRRSFFCRWVMMAVMIGSCVAFRFVRVVVQSSSGGNLRGTEVPIKTAQPIFDITDSFRGNLRGAAVPIKTAQPIFHVTDPFGGNTSGTSVPIAAATHVVNVTDSFGGDKSDNLVPIAAATTIFNLTDPIVPQLKVGCRNRNVTEVRLPSSESSLQSLNFLRPPPVKIGCYNCNITVVPSSLDSSLESLILLCPDRHALVCSHSIIKSTKNHPYFNGMRLLYMFVALIVNLFNAGSGVTKEQADNDLDPGGEEHNDNFVFGDDEFDPPDLDVEADDPPPPAAPVPPPPPRRSVRIATRNAARHREPPLRRSA